MLPTPDGKTIYGIRSSTQAQAAAAIFIVHGLTSTMQDYALKRAADFFAADYDVYRFNLYDGQPAGRSLADCTLDTHAGDLLQVLARYGARYAKVFLIGHSYGGPTVLLANPEQATAASLWDPSFDLHKLQRDFAENYVETEQGYLIDYGVACLIGKPMHEQAASLDEKACIALAQGFRHPFQVVHAADGVLVKGKSYHAFSPFETRHDTVAGTTHNFCEGDSCEDLLARTKAWFDRFTGQPED